MNRGHRAITTVNAITTVKGLLAVLAVIFALGAITGPCHAGSKIAVGRNWSPGDRISMDRIDHDVWDGLLRKYVDSVGDVNYSRWKASATDMRALDGYLGQLSRAETSATAARQAKLAFWINAYNAVTVKGILREYPTSSIRNHTARVFGYNIWKDLLLRVGDDYYGLEQIEHSVLRTMGEPRIHFAIVCASRSCPRLRNEAYMADTMEKQLNDNARVFFANPANFRYDARRGQIQLSTILSWFGKDFGRTQAEQLRAIAPYLTDPEARRLATSGRARVSFLPYDWGLNDQKTAIRSARR